MEKTFEFSNIKEFSESKDVNANNIISLAMHYDKTSKKYITKIEYGKKQ